jgi:ATP/maltotriose-dependent transcriptional regulator MalT
MSAAEIRTSLAGVALAEGCPTEAMRLCRQALDDLSVQGLDTYEHAWTEVFCRRQLGEIHLAQGELAKAAEHVRHALTLAREWHLLPATLHLLVSAASLSRR